MVIALNASQQATIRAISGISSPASPSGYPVPSKRSWCERTIFPTWPSSPPHPSEHLFALRRVRLDQGALLRCQRSRLVDQLLGDADLADVVEQRDELRVPTAPGVDPELLRHGEHEIDDVAAVRPRVGVVGLDDVAQQERGPAICMAQLEGPVDAHLPLAREDPEQADQGKDEQHRRGRAHRHQRNREADRGERRIERPDPDHEAQMRSRPQAERNPLACRRAGVVEDELCGQRGDEDRPLVPGRIGLSRGHQHERGPDRVPRVPREDGDPPQVMRLPTAGSELAESKPRRDRERHPGRRQHEEHRHEHEFGRNARSRPHLELDLRGDGVDHEQQEHCP